MGAARNKMTSAGQSKLPDVRAGGDHEQRRIPGLRCEPGHGGGAGLGALAAAEHPGLTLAAQRRASHSMWPVHCTQIAENMRVKEVRITTLTGS
jgi:hypothetical protein